MCVRARGQAGRTDIVMAYIVMVNIVMVDIIMAYIVMAYVVVACIVIACRDSRTCRPPPSQGTVASVQF